MMVMANLKFNGRGGVASDATGALALVKRAANLSYPEAETTLGNLLSADVRPPVDPIKLREAIDWYGKAVIVGSSEAMQGMGMAFLAIDEPEKAHPFLRRAASMGREYASRFLYLRFNEKVGNNIALEQDQILNKALERQKQRELIDRLTDPLAMAASILALSAIVGISVYDPDRKSDPKAEKGYQDYQRSTSGRANEAV
jgi:TPR repeat protein